MWSFIPSLDSLSGCHTSITDLGTKGKSAGTFWDRKPKLDPGWLGRLVSPVGSMFGVECHNIFSPVQNCGGLALCFIPAGITGPSIGSAKHVGSSRDDIG